jgi:hypothetical protein
MGLFISGLAINKNFKNELDVLNNILKMNVVKTEELTFEEALVSNTDLFYFDVYYTENGTLVLLNYDLCTYSYLINELNALSFVVSEHTDSYMVHYSENGKDKFNITKIEGRLTGNGKKIIKDNNITVDELIYQYIENLIGKNFFNIQNEEKIIRCHVSNYDWLKKEEINKTNILEPLDIKYFSDDELLNSFNKIVEYCILNNINFYLHPSLIELKNQKIIQNIIDLKKYIGYKESSLGKLKPQFSEDGYHAYYMIGRFNKENLDVKKSLYLFNLIKGENSKNNNRTDSQFDLNSDMILLIFAGIVILLLITGLIYVIYNVFTLP